MIELTTILREEYQQLFEACIIDQENLARVHHVAERVLTLRARYEHVSAFVRVPWFVVAALHNMESSLDFRCHLHNGDPLTARTIHVPAGRPVEGEAPFTWEESAVDALRQRHLHLWRDWSLSGALYQLEAYNGFGYRLYHRETLSPYLWSWSNQYTCGKYGADGKWSAALVSDQCGAATLLRFLTGHGFISWPPAPHVASLGDH